MGVHGSVWLVKTRRESQSPAAKSARTWTRRLVGETCGRVQSFFAGRREISLPDTRLRLHVSRASFEILPKATPEKKRKGRRRRFSTGTRRRRHLVHKRGGFHGIPVGLPWLHPNDPTLSASYPNHFGRSRGPVGDNKENSISQSIQPQDREQRF